MKSSTTILAGVFLLLMVLQVAMPITPNSLPSQSTPKSEDSSSPVDNVTGPVNTYSTSQQGMNQYAGTSSGLPTQVYSNRSDLFTANSMTYFPSNSSTSNTSASIPLGTGWEGYNLGLEFSHITENRTWFHDPEMEDDAWGNWTPGVVSIDGGAAPSTNWVSDTHDGGQYAVQFAMTGGGDPSEGERAYVRQHVAVPRGTVVGAWLRLDYNVWSDWGADGFVSVYVSIESNDYTQRVWQMSFGDVPAASTWYDSGLFPIPDLSIFNLANGLDIEVGLFSSATVNYNPDLNPYAKVDNVQLYLQTECAPTDINLKANGQDVLNYTQGSSTINGTGHITETPGVSQVWTNPLKVNFTWTPTPTPPDPDRKITVSFDVETNLYARGLESTVYTQDPSAYGESFVANNATLVNYTTWFNVAPPDGYGNRFYYNISLPVERNVIWVGSPRLTEVNYTYSWDEGQGPEWYANISAYKALDYAGYWLIESQGQNMINDITMTNVSSGFSSRFIDVRMNNQIKFSVSLAPRFVGSSVNITVFDPSGAKWSSGIATVDSNGFANSSILTFDNTASAGGWLVQAFASNSISGRAWNETGFFQRSFKVVHKSTFTLLRPSDAVGTYITNVTYPNLFIIKVQINDSDISGVVVSGGQMSVNWSTGVKYFGYSSGAYIITLDSSQLPSSGQYALDINWVHPYFDGQSKQLTLNLNLPSTIRIVSPDSPAISGPVGDNQTFVIGFADYFSTPLVSATFSCNWTGSWTVSPVTGSPGNYRFWLNTSTVPLGSYLLEITGKSPFVIPDTYTVDVQIRELYTSVDYVQNVLDIPVGQAASFLVQWSDTDHNIPLVGMSNYIDCNWTGNHITGDTNYTVAEVSAGTYNITIYTKDYDGIASYPVRVDFNAPLMQNHSIDITVMTRAHTTSLTLDQSIQQTSYGDDIIVLLSYMDTDLNMGIDNGTSQVVVTVSASDLPTISFSSQASSYGIGHYNLSIPTSQWATAGWKELTITMTWVGSQKYQQQTISRSIRIVGRLTDLYFNVVPIATYYLNNFTFSTVYYDVVSLSGISNSTGHVFLSIVPTNTPNPITQSDFVVKEIGTSGVYQFYLNTSYADGVGTFSFQLVFMWQSGVSPLYENKTLALNLLVRQRPTYIDYTPAALTAFGENATYSFSYVDSLSTETIGNSPSLSIVLQESYLEHTLYYDALIKRFTLVINTTNLDAVGSFTLHLNVSWTGSPYYRAVLMQEISITVVSRSSQLEIAPFTPGQYSDNVTLQFTYTDLISGSSTGLTGTLTLDLGSSYYHVTFLGDGMFTVAVNTTAFGATGSFVINATVIYTGTDFVSDAYHLFTFAVLPRATQLTYSSPENTAYIDNVTFTLTFTDDASGQGIAGATIAISCSTAAELLVENTNFWVVYEGSGVYTIRLDSSSLGIPAYYVLDVVVSRSGVPFYLAASRSINAQVIERPTQLVIVKTPGTTPFLDNVTIEFRYIDRATSILIALTKAEITLSHGSSPVEIPFQSYSLINHGTYYEISFNSTILDSFSLVSNHPIYLLLNRSSISPYFAERSSSLLASTVERTTQLLFPYISETPYYGNISVIIDYLDFSTGSGISGATVTVSVSNVTIGLYWVTDLGAGQYSIEIPTTQFGSVGSVRLNLSISRSGIPFYSSRLATNIPATIRRVQTSLIAETPPAGSVPVGSNIVINLTLTDTDHSLTITGASLSTDWTLTSAVFNEVGDGLYTLSLNTSGLTAQAYTFTVAASKSLYAIANISITVLPGASTVQITLGQSTYYAEWGEHLAIIATIKETYYFTPVPGMSVVLYWQGSNYPMQDLGNGSYSLSLDTSSEDFGNYQPVVIASKAYYQTRQKAFSLIVSKAPGQIVPEAAVLNVYFGSDLDFYVYLNDTLSNAAVSGAEVRMEWNNSIYTLTSNGTAGFYVGTADTSGFGIGQYSLTLSAFALNHDFLDISVSVQVAPIPTVILLESGTGNIIAYYGESLLIRFYYNDTQSRSLINGANVSYILGGLNGYLVQDPDGLYSMNVNTSYLAAQSLYLKIIASKDNYATSYLSKVTTILARPMSVSASDARLSGHFMDNLTFTFTLNDTLLSKGVSNAIVTMIWDGTGGTISDLGNGAYEITVTLNLTQPRQYPISISFKKSNYATATIKVWATLAPTPAEVIASSLYSVPVNETASISVRLVNLLTNSSITDISGIANWDQFGEDTLVPLANGNYSLTVPRNLPLGTYRVTITFPSSRYLISAWAIDIIVRQIRTSLTTSNTTIRTSPGSLLTLQLTYSDLDHNVGIDNAVVSVTFSGNNITYSNASLTEVNGVYQLYMQVNAGETFYVTVTFSKDLYQTQVVVFEIHSDITGEQVLLQAVTVGGGSALILLAIGIFLYLRVFSIPKQIREINRMLKKINKGQVPRPAFAPPRIAAILSIINEELRPLGLPKSWDDIQGESIEVYVPEVEELLVQLAALTGLGQVELDAFRADISRMRASERPGFIREVIQQEEARRADDIAKKERAEPEVETPTRLGDRPEELEEIRRKLVTKGMAPEEIDVILDEAKSLSKADLKALLDSLGIRLD
jgi:hypothetical protein